MRIQILKDQSRCLGKALVETSLKDEFDISVKEPITKFKLGTDAGIIPIRVEITNGKAKRVFSGMQSYVRHVLRQASKN